MQGLQEWLADSGRAVGLRRVSDLVDPGAYEATAILAQMEEKGAPPVVFPAAKNLLGERSPVGLAFNLYGNRTSLAQVLGIPGGEWHDILAGYGDRVQDLRATVDSTEAPVRDHVVQGQEVDVRMLPWVRHVEGEGGPFFTPISVSKQLRGQRYNLSWNRAMYLDPQHIGVHISPRQLWGFHREAEELGLDLPIALVLGHHPAFNLAAAAMTPPDIDEYHVAGALMGAPLTVTPSLTEGRDLKVPSHAEVVVEGRLLAGRRAVEGPFGEYMRYLGPQKLSHVFEVDGISWRSGAIASEIFAGYADHLNAHVAIHAHYLQEARKTIPQVTGLAWFEGGGPTTVVISMNKSTDGQPMRAALAVIAASNIVKQVIVVDDDIDIYNSRQVMWAVSTRTRADEDIEVIRGLQGNLLDPSQVGYGKASGLVIDATWPAGAVRPPSARVPPEAIESFRLADYNISEA